MAGRGPRPKDPATRARTNADPVPTVHLGPEAKPATPPQLPPEYDWHDRTVAWWETWRTSAQAAEFTSTDWDFLLDTALYHSKLWSGDIKAGTELRLRVAKFGATPEDRARLRWEAEKPDPTAKPDEPKRPSARDRYAGIRLVVNGEAVPEE